VRTSHLHFVRRWWLTLLLAGAVAGLSGYLIADRLPPTYQAEAKVLVGPVSADRDVLTASSSLVRTFAELASSPPVQEAALRDVGSDLTAADIAGDVQVRADGETRILAIQVRASSAQEAEDLANAIAAALQAVDTTVPRLPEGRLTLVQPATAPIERFGPQPAQVGVLAAMAGFIAAIVLVIGVDYLSDYIGAATDLPPGIRLLGVVPTRRRGLRASRTPVVDAPESNAAMLYQLLATNVAREGDLDSLAVVVAGIGRSEAAGEVAANLALALRRGGRRVRLLDADGDRRLADTTMGGTGATRDDIVQYDLTRRSSRRTVRRGALRMGARGTGVESTEVTFARMRMDADVVVLVAPPTSISPAAWVWSQFTDGIIIVVQAEQTARRALEQTLVSTGRAGATVLGIVMREPVAQPRSRIQRVAPPADADAATPGDQSPAQQAD
jgi:capsular polysaccharide biosynthesis protein